jgi:hypothetical protein
MPFKIPKEIALGLEQHNMSASFAFYTGNPGHFICTITDSNTDEVLHRAQGVDRPAALQAAWSQFNPEAHADRNRFVPASEAKALQSQLEAAKAKLAELESTKKGAKA